MSAPKSLREVAAERHEAELDGEARRVVADLKTWRERYPDATRVILDVVEVEALMRVVDASLGNP